MKIGCFCLACHQSPKPGSASCETLQCLSLSVFAEVPDFECRAAAAHALRRQIGAPERKLASISKDRSVQKWRSLRRLVRENIQRMQTKFHRACNTIVLMALKSLAEDGSLRRYSKKTIICCSISAFLQVLLQKVSPLPKLQTLPSLLAVEVGFPQNHCTIGRSKGSPVGKSSSCDRFCRRF